MLAFSCGTHPSFWVEDVGVREYSWVREDEVISFANKGLIQSVQSVKL
jgi:hypothetical protein